MGSAFFGMKVPVSKITEKSSIATPLAKRMKGAYFPFRIAHPTRMSMMQPKIMPAMFILR